MLVTESKDKITIVLDKNKDMTVSPSGKTLQVASSHGNVGTGLMAKVDNQDIPIVAGVNVFCKNPNYVKPLKA